MKVVYFDCPSGASGDMILGALIDAGVPLPTLRAELAKLGLPGFTLETREVRRGAFRATKADVVLDAQVRHHHRQLRDILAILGASQLPPMQPTCLLANHVMKLAPLMPPRGMYLMPRC